MEEILNLARWTPSGDNTQPWRFQVMDEASIAIRVRKDPSSVYEYRDGEPTVLAVGMLVESLRIAASAFGREMNCDEARDQSPDRLLVRIPPVADLPPDPLVSFLTIRSVDRRPYRWQGLQPDQKALLESSVTGAVALDWHEHAMARWRCARLNAMATDIRLRCPEAFPIHQRVIDWQHAFSADRIPARAVGLAGPVLPMLRWALKDWSHMQRMNRLGYRRVPRRSLIICRASAAPVSWCFGGWPAVLALFRSRS